MMRLACCVLMLAAVFWACVATSADVGVGALFDVGISARAEGMGGGILAACDPGAAAVYCPARLGSASGLTLTSMYAPLNAGVQVGGISASLPHVGMQLLVLDSGPLDANGSVLLYRAQALAVGAGTEVRDSGLFVGVRGRAFWVSEPEPAFGWALDPAVLVDLEWLRAAVLFEGAISKAVSHARGEDEEWERALNLGVASQAVHWMDVEWTLVGEVRGFFSHGLGWSLGLEARVGSVEARTGLGDRGAGIGLSVGVAPFRVDLAYVGHRSLGGSFRAGLQVDLPIGVHDWRDDVK